MHIGIDLGTMFCRIARVDARGIPALLGDHHTPDQLETPSIVHVGADAVLVGRSVEDLIEELPAMSVAGVVKLQLGSRQASLIDARSRDWQPEAVASMLLRKLRRDAQSHGDGPIDGAVLSVPGHFTDSQRRALCQAARLAGLPVLDLVEESVAAAVHYGVHKSKPGSTFLVYALGGAVAEATILRAGPDGLTILASVGVADLGGRDFDDAILAFLVESSLAEHGYDPRQDPLVLASLRRKAASLKMRLATSGSGAVRTALLVGGRVLEVILTRGMFERLTAALVERGTDLCRKVLEMAGVDWHGVYQVLLAGGTTLLPAVEASVHRVSGFTGDRIRRHHPQQAVTFGTALIAAGRAIGSAVPIMRRTARADLGFRVLDPGTRRPVVDVIIPATAAIPARKVVTYHSNRTDQARMVFEIVQVKGPGSEPLSLGHFAFALARPRKNHPLEVSLGYDELGLVVVRARDPETGQEVLREFSDSEMMSPELLRQQAEIVEIARLLD